MKKPSTAILGMSLGNSYFSEKNIAYVISATRERFSATKIMIPDYPTRYTLRALGETDIEKKIRLRGNALRNKVNRVIGDEENILNWKDKINIHPAYKKAVKELLQLSHTNKAFRDKLELTTLEVLASKVEIEAKKIHIGVKFLICELAFLISAREILGNEVTYVYHRPWPIFTDLISGKFDGITRDIGFEIIAKEG